MPEPGRKKIRRKITRTTKTTIQQKPQKTGAMKVSPFEKAPTSPKKEEFSQEPELEEAPNEEVGTPENRAEPESRKLPEETSGEKMPKPEEPPAEEAGERTEREENRAPGTSTKPETPQTQPKKGATKQLDAGVAGKGAKDIGKKAAGGAKKGLKGAASKAGSAATKAAGQVASKIGMALAPYLAPIGIGCAVIAALIGLVFLIIGCSGKLGTTPPQESTEKLETEAASLMGDISSQSKYSADLTSEMLELFNNSEIAEKISEGDLKIINDLLENIKSVPPTQKAQLEELTFQLNGKLKNIFDQLGVYIPPIPSHLDKLGKGTITRVTIDIGSRVLLFYGQKGEVLGFAPIYFGKTGDSKPDILNGDRPTDDINIIEALDSGKDSEFIDYSGRKCGRFVLKLSGWNDELDTDFRIIGSSLEDKIVTENREIKVLYATAGDLRMFSSDLSALAPYLNNLPIPVTFK